MNILKDLHKKFGEKITSAKWETEFGAEFLRIEVQEPNLEKLTAISKEISDYLDTIDQLNKKYFLDIFSSGTEKEITFDNIGKYIDKNIFISLKKPIKDKIEFEGKLIDVIENTLIIKWNSKGQFRKQKLSKNDIQKINLSAKLKKEKK